MPQNITDVEAFPSPVTAPADGDALDAASIINNGLQALANRTYYNNRILTKNAGQVTLPAPATYLKYIGAFSAGPGGNLHPVETGWTILSSGGYLTNGSATPSANIYFDLSQKLSRFESIQRVYCLVNPGAARAGGDRIEITLSGVDYGASFSAPTGPTKTDEGNTFDDGTASLQWIQINLTGSPISVGTHATWFLKLKAGNDCNVNFDAVYAVALECSTDRVTGGLL